MPLVPVPDVVGLAQADARARLQTARLVPGTVTQAHSTTVAAGSVISTTPGAGTDVEPGTAVNLEISSGPEKVPVPGVVGLAQADARARLQTARLVPGTVTQAHSTTVAAGSVISTTPGAGTDVEPGTAVNLEVSSGPEKVPVPEVVGLAQADARARLQTARLVPGIVTQAHVTTVAAGSVIGTIPGAGTLVGPGTAVNLEVSRGGTGRGGLSWKEPATVVYLAMAGIFFIIILALLLDVSIIRRLSDAPTARGVITFIISLAAIGLAFVLAFEALIGRSNDPVTFGHAREIFSGLMGILGTIIGFYFGSAQQGNVGALAIGEIEGTEKELVTYVSGGTPPYRYSIYSTDPGFKTIQKTSRNGLIFETLDQPIKPGSQVTVDVTDSKGQTVTLTSTASLPAATSTPTPPVPTPTPPVPTPTPPVPTPTPPVPTPTPTSNAVRPYAYV